MPNPITINESNITLTFPNEEQVFRFQDCQEYKELQSIQEMDVCWYDTPNNELYLIELKDWGDGVLEKKKNGTLNTVQLENTITKSRISNLVGKKKDSTLMLSAILLGTNHGQKMHESMPFQINDETTFRFINIINWTKSDTTYINSINSKCKTNFAGCRQLFSLRTPVTMTKAQAMQRFDWVTG